MLNSTLRNYFAAEMRKLRESAQVFARAHPELARQLNLTSLHDSDPYIERLLEGFAFLTAQIQQRLDDDVPEICEAFLMQICPQFLRPLPAATIIQFQARSGQLNKTHIIPKGFIIQNKPVAEEISCQFRTVSALNINPLKIIAVEQQEIAGANILKLHFKTDAKVNLKTLNLNELPIYIHADQDLTANLLFALREGIKEVRVNFLTQENFPMQKNISIKLSSMENMDSLIPLSTKDFMGFQLLLEYFAFREKFCFFTVQGLRVEIFPENAQEFILEIVSKIIFPKAYKLLPENFYLNCVPAVNLFIQTAEPIVITEHRNQYPIYADANNAEKIFLYSVDQVIGINQLTGVQQAYAIFNSFFYHENGRKNFFHIIQRDEGKKFPQNYLVFNQTEDAAKEQILSCAISVTNGHLPRANLLENSLMQAVKDLPNFIEVRNIIRPSNLLMPPKKENYHWFLLSHLSLNLQWIHNVEQLKQLLTLYEWTGREDNRRRIAGISALTVTQQQEIMRGGFVQGLQFDIDLQEENFSSKADLYLFAILLHQFFIVYSSLNMLIITKTTCIPSNQKFIWNSHS